MADSPGSPLSSHASSEFTEDVKLEDRDSNFSNLEHHDSLAMPPTKRQKLSISTYQAVMQPEDMDISSDTSGSVPNSPLTGVANTQDEDHGEQVTICMWRNCPAGDLSNMDALVLHIHDDHIGVRRQKYACEWAGCPRMDANHASGYALRAHMRSHTREKPFYCALPECDKSFTRSDALAKHMRTVHETEALRPSDPIPRGHSQAQVKPQRLKLIVNVRPSTAAGNQQESAETDQISVLDEDQDHDTDSQTVISDYPADLNFTREELTMPPHQLFRLLRRQVHWTLEENKELKEEVEALEKTRKEEWQAKELVLANVIEADLAVAYRSHEQDFDRIVHLKDVLLPETMLPMTGEVPWYRKIEPEAP